MRTVVLVVNFWIKAVTMVSSHLMTGRYIPHFDLNSLIFLLSFGEIFHISPHYRNDIA